MRCVMANERIVVQHVACALAQRTAPILYDSMSVIKSEATLKWVWEQIVVSLLEGDPRATDAYNRAWRSYWRRSDIWELLKEIDRNFDRQKGG